MKRLEAGLEVFPIPLDGMLVHRRSLPAICQVSPTIRPYPFIHLGGERHRESMTSGGSSSILMDRWSITLRWNILMGNKLKHNVQKPTLCNASWPLCYLCRENLLFFVAWPQDTSDFNEKLIMISSTKGREKKIQIIPKLNVKLNFVEWMFCEGVWSP